MGKEREHDNRLPSGRAAPVFRSGSLALDLADGAWGWAPPPPPREVRAPGAGVGAGGCSSRAFLAQPAARQSHNLEVLSSSLREGTLASCCLSQAPCPRPGAGCSHLRLAPRALFAPVLTLEPGGCCVRAAGAGDALPGPALPNVAHAMNAEGQAQPGRRPRERLCSGSGSLVEQSSEEGTDLAKHRVRRPWSSR